MGVPLRTLLTVGELFSSMAERVPAIKFGSPEPIGFQPDFPPTTCLGLGGLAQKAEVGG